MPSLPPSRNRAQVKRQVCDATHPWVSAEAAAGLNMDDFMEPQAGIISGQLANWYKAVANGWGSPSRGRAPHYNISAPAKPRRSLQGTCSGLPSFLNVSAWCGREW